MVIDLPSAVVHVRVWLLPAVAALNVPAKCDTGQYYLLNNYRPGYIGDGSKAGGSEFIIPPVSTKSIGDILIDNKISWAYFGEAWTQYLADPNLFALGAQYCDICNPFQYETRIMTGTDSKTSLPYRVTHLKDTSDFYNAVRHGGLPAVSFVKPSGLNDGHPESSKMSIFEAFVKKIIVEVQANKSLAADTAILITVDEGGGYYDSGYVQPLDYFGDGTRIPLIIVSPWTTGGHVSHAYGDHASVVKFIEANWGLAPLTSRSRDNLPNPTSSARDPYVPTNRPAITDLMSSFHF